MDILKLIENADLSDTKALDEIDRLYGNYVVCLKKFRPNHANSDIPDAFWPPIKFTRSRDALRSLWPDDLQSYMMVCNNVKDGAKDSWACALAYDGKSFTGCGLTPELAELYAIIQAIEYERQRLKAVS